MRNDLIELDGRRAVRFDYYVLGEPNILMTIALPQGDVLWKVACDPLPAVGVPPTIAQLEICQAVLASFSLTDP